MAGNLPPGVSPSHPHFNPPDRSHEHLWDGGRADEYPLFEDGAAIFIESCSYVEGRYGEGWQCEETRTTRCEIDRVIEIREEKPNITYLASEEDETWHIGWIIEDALILVETATDSSLTIEHIDPPSDLNDGYVEVSIGDYRVIYEQ